MGIRSALVILVLALAAPARAEDAAGETLYREHCASCHDSGVERAPDGAALRQMSRERIRASLTTGTMRTEGAALTAAQREALVGFLAEERPTASRPVVDTQCRRPPDMPADPFAAPHWNGWGVDAAERRFQPAAMARLAAADVPRLKLKWAFGFDGVSRVDAQPAVVGGRLLIGGSAGTVYALDARTGCIIWTFVAGIPVRTAISIGKDARGWTAYFGDLHATAYAVDAITGTPIWEAQVDDHPSAMITGAPVLAGPVLYVPVSSSEEVTGANLSYRCCTFRGSVAALDAASGKLLWRGYTIAEPAKPVRKNTFGTQLLGPSGAGVWSAPTIDPVAGMIYVTTGDSYSDPAASTSDAFVAFRLATGEMAWSRQMTAGDAFTVACGGSAPGQGNCP
jgi:polyvinyl alcohol dehydrogenase (cytochrome)